MVFHRVPTNAAIFTMHLIILSSVFGLVSAAAQSDTPGATVAAAGTAVSTATVAASTTSNVLPDQVGYASWYGTRFHGRLTANGEVYDMNKMTAANRTLPFGTRVLVTNLDNGKSCEVTINDRGPFVAGRIIDLSRAAAAAIGLTGQGVAKVRLHILKLGDGARVRAPNGSTVASGTDSSAAGTPTVIVSSSGPIIVQVGAFRDLGNAVRLRNLLDENGFNPVYEKAGDITRVVLVSVPPDEVDSIRQRLEKLGITSVLVRHE